MAKLTIPQQIKAVTSSSASTLKQKTILQSAKVLDANQTMGDLAGITKQYSALSATQDVAVGATTKLKSAFSSLGGILKSVSSVLAAHPAGFAVAAGAAIVGSVAVAAYANSYGQLKKKAQESVSTFQQSTSELNQINQEIETNQQRIQELEAKGSQRTKSESKELENRQIYDVDQQVVASTKETKAAEDSKAAAKDASKALTKKGVYDLSTEMEHENEVAYNGNTNTLSTYEKNDVVTATKNELKELEKLKTRRDELQEKDAAGTISKKESGELETLETDITDYTNAINENMATIGDLRAGLYDANGNVTAGNEDLAASVEKLYGSYDEIMSGVSKKEGKSADKILKQDEFKGAQQELIDALRNGEDVTIESILNEFPYLAAACNDAGVSVNELLSHLTNLASQEGFMTNLEKDFQNTTQSIQDATNGLAVLQALGNESTFGTGISQEGVDSFRELFGEDAQKALEQTSNGYYVNQEALGELEAKQTQLVKTDYLTGLSSQYEQLKQINADITDAEANGEDTSGLEKRRTSIEANIQSLEDLKNQYDASSSAFNQWQSAQAGGEEGDMYDSVSGGIGQAKNLYDQGPVGTNEFREFADLMSNQDLTTASTDKVVDAYEAILPTIDKYFSNGLEGVQTFRDEFAKLNEEHRPVAVRSRQSGNRRYHRN